MREGTSKEAKQMGGMEREKAFIRGHAELGSLQYISREVASR